MTTLQPTKNRETTVLPTQNKPEREVVLDPQKLCASQDELDEVFSHSMPKFSGRLPDPSAQLALEF